MASGLSPGAVARALLAADGAGAEVDPGVVAMAKAVRLAWRRLGQPGGLALAPGIAAAARAVRRSPGTVAGLLWRLAAVPGAICGPAPRCPDCALREDCPFARRLGPMKAWPAEARPRERLLAAGPEALGPAELLALVLAEGTRGRSALDCARELLAAGGDTLAGVAALSTTELQAVDGVGPAKAARVAAALELARRLAAPVAPPRRGITQAADVYARLAPRLRRLRHERFFVLVLDLKNTVLREHEISKGILDASLVHPREVFDPAIRAGAAGVILVHNHPSGDPEPSPEDLVLTRRLAAAGQVLGIPVLDHVIAGAASYVSFSERGLL